MKTIWNKIKRNPVRALTWGLSALVAVLAFAGVTEGPVYETAGLILLLLGGGEGVRSKVTPVKKK